MPNYLENNVGKSGFKRFKITWTDDMATWHAAAMVTNMKLHDVVQFIL